MSKNCVRCIKNQRTGFDLLCDECREKQSIVSIRRPIIKASSEHETNFRETWKLCDEVKNDSYWQMGYEYAATHKLYADEMSVIGPVLKRKKPKPNPESK